MDEIHAWYQSHQNTSLYFRIDSACNKAYYQEVGLRNSTIIFAAFAEASPPDFNNVSNEL